LGKVRPVLVVSVPFLENERTLCIVVPHTNSLRGTRFEGSVQHAALSAGAFDVQQTAAVQAVKFIQRLGALNAEQMGVIEQAVAAQRQANPEVLQSDASLVQIDLVRVDRRVLALPGSDIPIQHRGAYLVCISPGWKRQRRELYVLSLRQRLPAVPVPLREHESPVKLDLQALVEQVYETGRYDDLGYGADLVPPLAGEDAAWAETLLKATGRR
jgi:mRNA interferase MazF